jgi:hypothetical protein
MWTETAVNEGIYGVGIGRNPDTSPSASKEITLTSGEAAQVSKDKHDRAMKVNKGDTLFMADKMTNMVFEGEVLSDPDGPFRPSSRDTCFKKQVMRREYEGGWNNIYIKNDACQVDWRVKWKRVGPITPQWIHCLRPHLFGPTIFEITGAVPL